MKKITLANIPSSVYRLQVNESFPLKKAIEILPYLVDLGIEGIYLSPIFECTSTHGYDITNPNRLNPLLGTMQDFEEFCQALVKADLKLVLDTIPNHMGIRGGKNKWWLNVCEYGKDSSFAPFFDINWNPEKQKLKDKVLLPILNSAYGYVLENQQFSLYWEDGFWITYGDHHLPIAPHTYKLIIECGNQAASANQSEWAECIAICNELSRLEKEEVQKITKIEAQKKCLVDLYNRSEYIRKRFEEQLLCINGNKDDPASFDALHELLEKQFYRLSYWGVAGQEINYRRFFNINDLIAIRIENEEVLNTHHEWLFELLRNQKVQGLRIDHPDGLYDPVRYFERLQARGPEFVVAEKILNVKETLPENWPVEGSVGYDFLNLITGLFIQNHNEEQFDQIYEKFIGKDIDFKTLLYERKLAFIISEMAGEIHFLASLLDELSDKSRYYRDFTRIDLQHALVHTIACFPVYRTYITKAEGASKQDKAYVTQAIEMAKTKAPEIDPSIFQYLKGVLLFEYEHLGKDEAQAAMDIALRFQQLTGPVMAKGLEDSVYYIYNRLISLNEVGSNPKYFGSSKTDFHQFNKEKLSKWPLGYLATSTHDTKMSEDVRMRINVLSELAQKWLKIADLWQKMNQKLKKNTKVGLTPDSNTEYYIYQMLLGIWPQIEKEKDLPAFLEHIWTCLRKVIREAGIYTNWKRPNEEYETAVKEFLFALLSESRDNTFYPSFLHFHEEISLYGMLNTLSAFVLKIGSCGISTVYQGNEEFKYNLMDPDNRRACDFETLKAKLQVLPQLNDKSQMTAYAPFALDPTKRHQLKLFIARSSLHFRKQHKELFLQGEYISLPVHENKGENVIAFLRKYKDEEAIVITGRFYSQISEEHKLPIGESQWGSTKLSLPDDIETKEFFDIFTGKALKVQIKNKIPTLALAEIFESLPFTILSNKECS